MTSPKAGVYWPSISYGYCTYLYGFIPEYHTKNVHEFGVISKQLEALPADTSVPLPNKENGFGIDTPAIASITFRK